MAKTDKIAVTIDRALLARAEEVRRRTGESRSALLARALRALLRTEAHQRDVQRYVAALRETPETDEDVAAARSTAHASLRSLPWEDE